LIQSSRSSRVSKPPLLLLLERSIAKLTIFLSRFYVFGLLLPVGTSSYPLSHLNLQTILPHLPKHLPIYDPSHHLHQHDQKITPVPFDSSPFVVPGLIRRASSSTSIRFWWTREGALWLWIRRRTWCGRNWKRRLCICRFTWRSTRLKGGRGR